MKFHKIKLEQCFYLLAFLLALCFRFINLGKSPLADSEADLALKALELSDGNHISFGGQPGYVLLTSCLFFMFGSSEILARFWPAVVGSIIIFVPYLFSNKLGRSAAIILAFMMALDPGLVAISRQADGLILAISFLLLAAGFFNTWKPEWAGIFLGLALLSGTGLWAGVLSITLIFGWLYLKDFKNKSGSSCEQDRDIRFLIFEKNSGLPYHQTFIWTLGCLFFIGTLFLNFPTGLSGMVASLPIYINGWGQSCNIPIQQLFIALFAYEFVGIIFGLWGCVWGWVNKEPVDTLLAQWFFIILFIIILYPAHRVVDLAWALIPLWALAARQVARHIKTISDEWQATLGQALFVIVILVFTLLNLMGIQNPLPGDIEIQMRWVSIGGAILILLLETMLVVWGWSRQVAISGLIYGVCIMTAFFSLYASWNAAGLGKQPDTELWRTSPYFQESDLLLLTIENVSEWNTGRRNTMELVAVDVSSPALQWLLRGINTVSYVNFLPGDARPAMVITSDKQMPSLAYAYSGQDFISMQKPLFSLILPSEWMRWWFYREMPLEKEMLVLWVRSDLFPGGYLSVE